jgi:hypothetical protein
MWNHLLPELWKRTTTAVLEALPGYSVRYVRVVELQARGLAHVHVVLILDPIHRSHARSQRHLRQALRGAALATRVGEVTWGRIFHVRFMQGSTTARSRRALEPSKMAGYIAKYATKGPEHALKHREVGAELRDHLDRLRVAATAVAERWSSAQTPIAEQEPQCRRRAEKVRATREHHIATAYGFGGHFLSKSAEWGVTFRQLRERRRAHILANTTGVLERHIWVLDSFGLHPSHEEAVRDYWSLHLAGLGYDPPWFAPF